MSDIVLSYPEYEPTVKNPADVPIINLNQLELKKLFSSTSNINTPLKCIKHSKI